MSAPAAHEEIVREQVPAARAELQAVVGATEEATNAIFAALESIERLAEEMAPHVADRVAAAATRIYEACGFQDIAGQRVGKVDKVLQAIEVEAQALLGAAGSANRASHGDARPQDAAPGGSGATADDELMRGPQLPDEALGQDEVDGLLASFD